MFRPHDVSMVVRTGRDERGGRRQLFVTDLLELGAVVVAGAAAHTIVLVVGHSAPAALVAVGLAVLATVTGLRCWRHFDVGARESEPPPTGVTPDTAERLWRIRTAVPDAPGGLAALTTELSRLGVNIRLVQVHPGDRSATDEFLVTSPGEIDRRDLDTAIRRAGGEGDPVIKPADVHELTDTTSHALTLVAAVSEGVLTIEAALARLLGVSDVLRTSEAPGFSGGEGVIGWVMVLSDPRDGFIHVHRPGVGFTPVEFARARAFLMAISTVQADR